MVALLQEQLVGGNGELKAAMQYMSQSFRIKDLEIKDLFLDIAAEELGHMEMVAQTIKKSPEVEFILYFRAFSYTIFLSVYTPLLLQIGQNMLFFVKNFSSKSARNPSIYKSSIFVLCASFSFGSSKQFSL